jgi:hypothetical protein
MPTVVGVSMLYFTSYHEGLMYSMPKGTGWGMKSPTQQKIVYKENNSASFLAKSRHLNMDVMVGNVRP